MATAKAPGRLGDPNMSPDTDPRTHPSMLEAMKPFGLHLVDIPEKPTADSPMEEIMAFARAADQGISQMYGMMNYDVPALTSSIPTTRSEEYVDTPDGHKVKLIIYRPTGSEGTPLPGIMYTHGGGMVILSTENYVHMKWLESLASTGLVAIAIDYRNGITQTDHNPFPTGLNDCAAAVKWVHAHRQQLAISKIILNGESGGGNLAIATTLKAKKEGWLDHIAGVVASVPYVSGAYGAPLEWKLQNLPSLVECDGYFISSTLMAILVKIYDPTGENAQNPLAWPYWASIEDLKGLPPFVIFVNELDPLRDEGAVFYRKLVTAGVRVTAQMNMGALHGGELLFRHALPDQFLAEVGEINMFAQRV